MTPRQFQRAFLTTCFFSCFLMFTLSDVQGQGSRPMSSVDRRVDTLNRHQETFEKDNMTRDTKSRGTVTAETRKRQAEVEEDLYALQSAYNKILVALHKTAEPSPGFADTLGAEVKKHAARLRNNLALPKPEKEAKEEVRDTPAATVDRLRMMTRLLYSFITNPIFDNLATMDLELGKKAGNDLDGLIEIAEGLVNTP